MSKTLVRATILKSRTPVWTLATSVHAVVIPSDECRYAYGDTQPDPSLEGSVAYNQDTIENPKGGKLWLMPTVATIQYVVHEF